MSRHTVLRAPIALVAAVVTLLAMTVPAFAQEPTTRLDGGGTPAGDAVAWSQASFADGSAPDVIIARDDDFADSLASGAVQGLLTAPLLLTNTTALSPEAAAEITRLGSTNAIVLGLENAVSAAVVTEIEGMGLTTERIGGPTRLETAVNIVNRFFPNATAITLARAFGTDTDPSQAFADSLALGPYDAVTNIPTLLTEIDTLSGPTAAALSALPVQWVTVVGGTEAVGQAVQDAAVAAVDDGDDATDETVERVAGANRFGTAVALSNDLGYTTAADASRVILSEGQNDMAWTSGFPAGVQAGNDAATVLANGDSLPQETIDFITGASVPLICGPGVSEAACDAAEEAING